jgi:hypothetical protein
MINQTRLLPPAPLFALFWSLHDACRIYTAVFVFLNLLSNDFRTIARNFFFSNHAGETARHFIKVENNKYTGLEDPTRAPGHTHILRIPVQQRATKLKDDQRPPGP